MLLMRVMVEIVYAVLLLVQNIAMPALVLFGLPNLIVSYDP